MATIKDRYTIAGIGHTEYSSNSGRSELHLTLEAIMAAVKDAGLDFKDIDGIVGDNPSRVDVMTIGSALGLQKFGFFIETEFAGGGVPSGLLHAIAGMEAGRATHVICYKSLNGFSKNSVPAFEFAIQPHELGFEKPFGLLDPVAYAALVARRHMHQYGTTSRQFGAIALAYRKHANRNPNAIMHGESMTIENHQQSILIADPLRQLDCYVEADGAAACVVTSAERARDLKQLPVYIMAASQACGPGLSCGTIDPTVKENETRVLARNLFSMAGLTHMDIDVLQVYDDYTPLVLMAIENLGFCEKGEGGGFVEGGSLEWADGDLPMNTSGGNLSEGCIEGFNHIIEAVKQLRGISTAQVKDAEIVLVSGANGGATSGLILRR